MEDSRRRMDSVRIKEHVFLVCVMPLTLWPVCVVCSSSSHIPSCERQQDAADQDPGSRRSGGEEGAVCGSITAGRLIRLLHKLLWAPG